MLTRFFQKLDTNAIQATEWKVSQLWSAIQQAAGLPLNFHNAFVKIFIVSIYIQIDSFDNESEYKTTSLDYMWRFWFFQGPNGQILVILMFL